MNTSMTSCPVCGVPTSASGINDHVNSHFDTIYCPICETDVASATIEDHYEFYHEDKLHTTIERCPHPGCGQQYKRDELTDHLLVHELSLGRRVTDLEGEYRETKRMKRDSPGELRPIVPVVPGPSKTRARVTTNAVSKFRQSYAEKEPTAHKIIHRKITHQAICDEVDYHHSGDSNDWGWGCGYKNCQMLISSLARDRNCLTIFSSVPTIGELQKMLDEAWRCGYDVEGAKQLGYRIIGTRKWVGATDICALLRYKGIASHVVDIKEQSSLRAGQILLNWMKQYFNRRMPVTHPVYLQWQGHSITVFGYEQRSNGDQYLLILDPSKGIRKTVKGFNEGDLSMFRRKKFDKSEYQMIYIDTNPEYLTEVDKASSKVIHSVKATL